MNLHKKDLSETVCRNYSCDDVVDKNGKPCLAKNIANVEKMFRLMCFNVFAHNRDGHLKNFSFLYDEEKSSWQLSPAYDLTYSNSIGGEHATTVNGEGKNPAMKDILKVAEKNGIKISYAKEIADEVENCVQENLGRWIK